LKALSALRERVHNAHADHHAIARGMASVALFVLLGSVVRAGKEMSIAYRYGVSADVDAYLFVFNLVNWPVGVWFSVLTLVLVPLAARMRQEAAPQLPRFRSELLGFAILLGLALALLGWLGLPFVLRSSWAGLPGATQTLATAVAGTLTLTASLGVVSSVLSAWMLAAERHANTLLEAVPALVLLVALIAFPGGSIEPLVWGTLAGFALHLASLTLFLARHGEIETPRYSRASPEWTPFWQGFGIMLAGQAIMSLTGIVDQFFAAHLGTGVIAALNYANRILALLLGLGAMAVSRATLPVFSRALAQGGEQARRLAAHWVRLLFALGVVATVIGWGLAPWGVRLLFERGAFTAGDTLIVSDVLRYGLIQLPFYFAGIVLVSLLASQGRHRVIAAVAGITLLVKAAANFILVPSMGVNGLLVATALMYASSASLLWLGMRLRNRSV
jgi:peptidoglycan biosynthesis protein MviN/MurJ (putative lipid II flippase)